MTVKVLYFASLRERLGRAEQVLDVVPGSVSDAWRLANDGAGPPDGVLCALNHDYATWDAAVRDGDEVAFFPPVTGG